MCKVVTSKSFRSQAQKIAKIALEQMPADQISAYEKESNEEEFHTDSEKKSLGERTVCEV